MIAGGIVLFPSLGVLFRLFLADQLGAAERSAGAPPGHAPLVDAGRLVIRGAEACLVLGLGLLVLADAGWAHAVGASALLVFAALAARVLISADVLGD